MNYREVVEDQLDLICRFGMDFRLTFVNEPYAQLYSRRPEELVGQRFLDGVLSDYQTQVLAHLSVLTIQQPVAVDENPTSTFDGSVRWFHWIYRLIAQRDGAIEYQAVGRDITARKQAEAVEQEQRQLAEAMRDSLAALTSSLDIHQVMAQILTSAATVVASDAGRIVLIEEGYSRTAYTRGFTPEAVAWLNEYACEPTLLPADNIFCARQPYVVADTHRASHWLSFPAIAWIRSSIGVPIQVQGEVIGLLIADSALPHLFQTDDIEKLQTFAYYAGLALNNAYYAARLEERVAERTAAWQASDAKFRQLLQAAPVAIIISDQAGRITFTNQQATVLLGYPVDELLQQPIEILVPEAARTAHVDKRQGYTAELRSREMGSGLELFARCKDGSLVPVEIQLSYLKSADGLLVMSFILDITERKQAANALRQQRDFLQTVIDHIPGIITVINYQGQFQLANRYMAQNFATTPLRLVGKTIEELNFTQHHVDRLYRLRDEVFTHRQPVFVPEGQLGERYYQADLIPLSGSSDTADQVLIVAADITERKAAEVALAQALAYERELSELKSGFITTASHEFRTPLAIILSTTDTLRAYRHRLTDEQIEQRLRRISTQVEHLKEMMDSVFDLARMHARRVSFQPVPCKPATLCHDLFVEFQNHFEMKHQLFYTCANHLPAATLDVRLLRQIVSNLLANAVKFSPEDKVVQMDVAYRKDTLVLMVRDEGIGIPADDLKHLFLPFHRAANVGNIPGTGLGLSIAKEATELHGGTITVESRIGVGTTFTVMLPLVTGAP